VLTLLQEEIELMAELEFQSAANRYFEFLITEYGYKCTESTTQSVRFESEDVSITLSFDRQRSYELNLYITHLSSSGSDVPAFTIFEILRLRANPEANEFALIQLSDKSGISKWVYRLAEKLRSTALDLICGDATSFSELFKQRKLDQTKHQLDRELRIARIDAEVAWQKKEYRVFVKLLEPYRSALSTSEIKKIDYASKHLRNASIDNE